MIDTNELQLGNKVYYDNGALVKVVDVASVGSVTVNDKMRGNFNPIPLTDDFGLTYLDNSGVPVWKQWFYKSKFKFVHRLQNYFNLKQLTQ